eukprot:jgi/Ulvmu1/9664/UM055_0001.1
MAQVGVDENGKDVKSEELWQRVEATGNQAWYKKAVEYWDRQEASYDGVLGGFGFVSDVDIRDSTVLLRRVFKKTLAEQESRDLCALDAGAGVGRVTEQLLLHYFGTVDLLEPSAHLLDSAKERLAAVKHSFPAGHAPGAFLQHGLETFCPQADPPRYDCIWLQWCLLYLTDDDLVALLLRCVSALRPGGAIVVKENVCAAGFVVDGDDNSLTRSHAYWMGLFSRAELAVTLSMRQKGMPEQLYAVKMYAVRPKGRALDA